jgi:large repetitive protein
MLSLSLVPIVTTCIDGQYSYTPDLPLIDGSYTITAQSIDEANNVSSVSPQMTVVIDTVVPPQMTGIVLTQQLAFQPQTYIFDPR